MLTVVKVALLTHFLKKQIIFRIKYFFLLESQSAITSSPECVSDYWRQL